MFKVEIRTLEPMRLIGLPHTGPYAEIGPTYSRVWELLAACQWFRSDMHGVAIYYDNPEDTAPESLRSFASFIVPETAEAGPPLTERALAGGEHAVLSFFGPYEGLPGAYQWLYGTWLPESGRAPAPAPPFEVYRNNPSNAKPEELLTEICAPLAPA